MNKKEALNLKVDEEILTNDEYGYQYSNYKIKTEEDNIVECKLIHSLINKRFPDETFLEYQIRRHHIKRYQKTRGRMVWFSKNTEAIANYKIARGMVKAAADMEISEEVMAKGMENLETAEKLARYSNVGTYNKKEVEEAVRLQQEQKEKEDNEIKTDISE